MLFNVRLDSPSGPEERLVVLKATHSLGISSWPGTMQLAALRLTSSLTSSAEHFFLMLCEKRLKEDRAPDWGFFIYAAMCLSLPEH